MLLPRFAALVLLPAGGAVVPEEGLHLAQKADVELPADQLQLLQRLADNVLVSDKEEQN